MSSDHPALSFENLWFSCSLFCFPFSPYQYKCVFCSFLEQVFHISIKVWAKVASSVNLSNAWVASFDMFFFIVGGNQKKQQQEKQRN